MDKFYQNSAVRKLKSVMNILILRNKLRILSAVLKGSNKVINSVYKYIETKYIDNVLLSSQDWYYKDTIRKNIENNIENYGNSIEKFKRKLVRL